MNPVLFEIIGQLLFVIDGSQSVGGFGRFGHSRFQGEIIRKNQPGKSAESFDPGLVCRCFAHDRQSLENRLGFLRVRRKTFGRFGLAGHAVVCDKLRQIPHQIGLVVKPQTFVFSGVGCRNFFIGGQNRGRTGFEVTEQNRLRVRFFQQNFGRSRNPVEIVMASRHGIFGCGRRRLVD